MTNRDVWEAFVLFLFYLSERLYPRTTGYRVPPLGTSGAAQPLENADRRSSPESTPQSLTLPKERFPVPAAHALPERQDVVPDGLIRAIREPQIQVTRSHHRN